MNEKILEKNVVVICRTVLDIERAKHPQILLFYLDPACRVALFRPTLRRSQL